jgi:signal transduction histidine kinase
MSPSTIRFQDHVLGKLVTAALETSDLSALQTMLSVVAEALASDACAIWQVQPRMPGSRRGWTAEPKIFAVAAYPGSPYPEHDLPLTVPSGRAMDGRLSEADLWKSGNVEHREGYLKQAGLNSLCSVALRMDRNTPGSLTVYRKRVGEWTESEFRLLEFLAEHVPRLYTTVRERSSLRLLERVATIIQEAETTPDAPLEYAKKALETTCRTVASDFRCLESSLFLENPHAQPCVFQLVATTCPQLAGTRQYRREEAGLTSWVLSNGPIGVIDIAKFDPAEYEGLVWQNREVRDRVRELLNLGPEDEVPPISFMAVPVRLGNKTLGVIRCCASHQPPHYFTQREVDLLEILGSRIGPFWGNLMARQGFNLELEAWKKFLGGVSEFNNSFQDSVTNPPSDQKAILRKAVEVAKRSIPGAEYVDISLFEQARRQLSVVVSEQDLSLGGSDTTRRPHLTYNVDENPPRSPGAVVFRTQALLKLDSGLQSPGFPGVKRGIFCPISEGGEFLGMFAARSGGDLEFPQAATEMLQLLSHLTGLYIKLQIAIQAQTQTYQDLQHQLRNPIFQAQKRARAIPDAADGRNLEAVRGLLGKARRVVINQNLFAGLATGGAVRPNLQKTTVRELIKPLIEAASDNEALWRSRRIAFTVERSSFELDATTMLDMNLFEQAVSNILDNAGKYTFKQSTVYMRAQTVSYRRLHVSFLSRSIPISREDANQIGTRGWRGKAAIETTAEGSGIGLWIVRNILLAHNGRLVVLPTRDGWTEILMELPLGEAEL